MLEPKQEMLSLPLKRKLEEQKKQITEEVSKRLWEKLSEQNQVIDELKQIVEETLPTKKSKKGVKETNTNKLTNL